jgi:hypothetical protein
MIARTSIALVLGIAVIGCAADDPGPPRIEASVAYSGTAAGTLVVAAFPSIPPQGPPVAFAQKSAAKFPAMLVLEAVEPGATVYVLAMLDVVPASPQQPGPEDRTAWSEAVVVDQQGATVVTLALTDP